MNRLWLVSLSVALCACGGSTADRDTSDLADLADSADSADPADSDTTDAPQETLEVSLTPSVDLLGRCESTPASSFGRVAWMDGDTLAAQRPSDSGPARLFTSARAGLRRPVIALGAEFHPTAPAFVVTSVAADIATIEILDHQGNLRAATDLPGVAMPALTGSTHLVVPLAAESSSIQWVSLGTGAPGYVLPVASAPTTAAAPFGPSLLSGGGSHWVVGLEGGLLSVADRYLNRRLEDGPIDPLVTADLPSITGRLALDGSPRALLVLGDRLVVHLERGSSHRLVLFRIAISPNRVDFIELGTTDLPSAPTTQPVGIDCQLLPSDPGFCPRFEVATVIIGGAGWLGAFHLSTGTHVSLSTEPITWTGLALGRGGWVAGGGSHWLPSEPEPTAGLWLAHPVHELLPVLEERPTASACVPPPVWDHAGLLVVPSSGKLALVELGGLSDPGFDTIALGPASGPTRSGGGDNQNTQRDLDGLACEDGTIRGLDSVASLTGNIQGLRLDHPQVLVFGTLDEVPFFQWFAPPASRWRMDPVRITDAASIEQVEVLSDDTFVVAIISRSGEQLLERYLSEQIFLHRTNIGSDGIGRAILGLVPQGNGHHIIAEYPATLALVRELDGRLSQVDFGDAPNGADLRLLAPRFGALGEGAVLVVVDGDRVILRRVDAALGEQAVVIDTSLSAPSLIDATTDSEGTVRLLLEDGQDTWLWRYDEDLVRVGVRRVPSSRGLITGLGGDGLLVNNDGLARLTRDDALGLTRAFALDAPVTALRGGATATGYSLGILAEERLFFAQVDILGGSGCLAAGACTGSRMLACDLVEPCLAIGCEPTTGDCREEVAVTCDP